MRQQLRYFALGILCLCLLMLSKSPTEAEARQAPGQPTRITNLTATTVIGSPVLALAWQAPMVMETDEETGDQYPVPASRYEIRYSDLDPGVTGINPPSQSWWSGASVASNPPVPSPPGANETWDLTGLVLGSTYYVAICSFNRMEVASAISNVARGTTLAAGTHKKWNFMVYLDGDNNLEGMGIDDFNEMERVGSTADIHITVQFDRIDGYDSTNGNWTDTRRYYVTQDSNAATINSILVQDMGEVNMGDPNSLKDFVNWSSTNFPADNYVLVLWNHGSGLRAYPNREVHDLTRDVCWDDTNGGDALTIPELKVAFSDLTAPFAIVDFDACLMGMTEVAYDLRDKASYVVFSQDLVPGDGNPYDTVLGHLAATPTMDSATLASTIVNDYFAAYSGEQGISLSAVDTSKLPSLLTAANDFALAMKGDMTAQQTIVQQQLRAAQSFEDYSYPDYHDLYDFARLVKANVTAGNAAAIQAAADSVMSAVTGAVVLEKHSSDRSHAHGLSVWLPEKQLLQDYIVKYQQLDFAKNSKWEEFLYALWGLPPLDSVPPAAVTDLAAGQPTSNSVTLTWTATANDGTDAASGLAETYDVRYRVATDGTITGANWDDAKTVQVTGEPAPQAVGSAESFVVRGLSAGTSFYFAMKVADDAPNWSGLSNVVGAQTDPPDVTAPGAVTDLAASDPWAGAVLLTWTAPGDDGNTGTASAYDIRYSTSPITAVNWGSATQATGEPTPQVAGASESFRVTGLQPDTLYYFALKTGDEVPTWSSLSNVPSARTLLPSKIAFTSDRDGNDEIYVMDSDGANQTRLTNNAAADSTPCWSPDGSRIAFASNRDGNDEIYVMKANGTNQTRLTNSAASDSQPSWSPDGSRIAFTSERDGNNEIYLMSPDGTNQTRLTNSPTSDSDPSWSPDGSRIAFTSNRDGNWEIYVMNSDGTAQTDISNDLGADVDPDWRPDGAKIAFASDGDIYTVNPDGTGRTAWFAPSTEGHYAGEPSWSPGGVWGVWRAAITGDLDGNYEVYCIGPPTVRLTDNPATDQQPSWSPFVLGLDTTPPGAVADLAVTTTTSDSATLIWTAPADDGYTGFAASQYDIRYSTSPINAGNFDAATQATGEPYPAAPGTTQTLTITPLAENTKYYFALKTADEVPNWSGLSNVAEGTTLADTTPPSQITDLAAGSPTGSSVTLSWTAVGDDGNVGTATGYDVRYSISAITDANWDSATQATGEPTPGAPGTAETFVVPGLAESTPYYFAVKAYDDHTPTPNYSPLSNVATATTLADTTPPGAVTNLAAGSPTGTSINLTWTAPGDDGNVGTATSYDIRYAASAITQANWASATQVTGEPAPAAGGSSESFTVPGLSPSTTYFFALKTTDDKGNTSAVSNSPNATTLDTLLPAAITDLAAANPTANSIQLTWTAPGDDGASGTAAAYDIRYSTSTITDANWASATQVTGEPAPGVAGTQESHTVTGLAEGTVYYFAMKTADEFPNWSGLSNVATATTPDVTPPAAITTLATSDRAADSVTLSWTAVGDDGTTGTATSYDIRYSTAIITAANWAGATQASAEPAPQVAGSSETFTVPGLSEDTKYFFAVKAVDDFDNSGELSNVVSDRTLATMTLPVSSGWTMFGASMHPTGTDLKTWLGISGLSAAECKVERWSPAADQYIVAPSTNPVTDAVEGRGFWIWLSSARAVDFLADRVESTETTTIPLPAGWNQVATPFEDAALDWSTVKVKTAAQTISQAVSLEDPAATPLVANYAWAYRGGEYRLVHGTIGEIHEMAPWEGLWILAQQDCELVLSGPSATSASVPEKAAPPSARRSPVPTWLVRLGAAAGEARDSDNYLGVADRSFQMVGPPHLPGFVDLHFTAVAGGNLAADLRGGTQDALVWDIEVETDLKDTQVSLNWPDLSQVPRGYRLTLYDLDANRTQQMRTTSAYLFNSGQGGIRHFRIEVKRAALGTLLVANLASEQTRGATSITYVVTQDATVRIEVFTLSGSLVRRLVDGQSVRAGENEVVWDGRDDQGRLVPPGTYLCEVTASGEDGQSARASRTMVVLR